MWSTKVHPHETCSVARLEAYADLFGAQPIEMFPYHEFARPDDEIRIDVAIYRLLDHGQEYFAAVTNGLSDEGSPRWELVQYLTKARHADAHRLHGVAYAVREAALRLGPLQTVELTLPPGSHFPNAILLTPPMRRHAEFTMDVDGDEARLLWDVPLTQAEMAYKTQNGTQALLNRMEAVKLPAIFDPVTRPSLL